MEQAFLSFDSSSHGYISKQELMGLLVEPATAHVPKRRSSGGSADAAAGRAAGHTLPALAQARFAELDRSGDGRIDFVEFLFCLERWVEDAEEGNSGVAGGGQGTAAAS